MLKPVTEHVSAAFSARSQPGDQERDGSGAGIRSRVATRLPSAVYPEKLYPAVACPAWLGPADCSAFLPPRAAMAIMTNAQPLNIISMPNNMPITHKALVGNWLPM